MTLSYHALQTRRTFLRDGACGLGAIALASLLDQDAGAAKKADDPLAPRKPHFAAKVKNVIVLHLSGAPPHLDLFDYKPELVKQNGKPCPDSLLKGKRFAFTSGVPKLLGTPQKFRRRGKSGAWVSDALPEIARIADDLTFLKAMYT